MAARKVKEMDPINVHPTPESLGESESGLLGFSNLEGYVFRGGGVAITSWMDDILADHYCADRKVKITIEVVDD